MTQTPCLICGYYIRDDWKAVMVINGNRVSHLICGVCYYELKGSIENIELDNAGSYYKRYSKCIIGVEDNGKMQ